MRAAVLTAEGRLAVAEVDDPEPGPGEVLVAVDRCGICGSDLHLRRAGVLPAGTIMGHELSGRVVARGDGGGPAEGARVAVFPSAPCGSCRTCLEGRHEICLQLAPTAVGLGPVPGGYAEAMVAATASCFPLPDAVGPELGALTEPYAVGLHAVRRSGVRPGDPVGVIGAGPIGLTTLAALRAEGVGDVVVAERNPRRRAAAGAVGATAVVEDATRIDGALGEQPAVVFECAGAALTTSLALQLVRPGGTVALVGVAGFEDPLSLVGAMLVIKEVDVVPCLAYTLEEFGTAVDHLAAGALDPGAVVSEVRPLEDAEAAFADLERPDGPVKLLLAPDA